MTSAYILLLFGSLLNSGALGISDELWKNLVPLKIAVISGYGTLEPAIQEELQNSLKWFQNAFLVHQSEIPVKLEDVYSRIPEYRKFSSVIVQTSNHRSNLKLASENMRNLLKTADFSVFVVAQDPKKCARNPDLLAEALPIILVPDNRPPLATMSICLNNHPKQLTSRFFYDLFRHEILHGLGYGLIIDKSAATHKSPMKYTWRDAKGVGRPGIKHFLDFGEFALEKAKHHFECHKLAGIEADGERKNHLNEYIFGNELMTTHLEPFGNVFSWISAGIIERTYNGERQWYHVNSTFVSSEARQYSYGRSFGCEFLNGSCHDFIRIAGQRRLNISPFCGENMCYKAPGTLKLIEISKNQCENRRVTGEKEKWCPMIKNLPASYIVQKCSQNS